MILFSCETTTLCLITDKMESCHQHPPDVPTAIHPTIAKVNRAHLLAAQGGKALGLLNASP
jgi:hypothetical protein